MPQRPRQILLLRCLKERTENLPSLGRSWLGGEVRGTVSSGYDDLAGSEIKRVRLPAYAHQHRVHFPSNANVHGQVFSQAIVVLPVHVEEVSAIAENLDGRGALHAERIAEEEVGKRVARVSGALRILRVAAIEIEGALRGVAV